MREGFSTAPRSAKEEGGQGGGAPLGLAGTGAPCAAADNTRRLLRLGRRISLMGRHTSSSYTTPLHHLHYNLLENTMFNAIYYFPVIYCVVMSCVQ
jgi:hypothetical protein